MTSLGVAVSMMFSAPFALPVAAQEVIGAGATSHAHQAILQSASLGPMAAATLAVACLVGAGSFVLAGATMHKGRVAQRVVPGTWWLR